jgi:very-short-patch-repair endonuclease
MTSKNIFSEIKPNNGYLIDCTEDLDKIKDLNKQELKINNSYKEILKKFRQSEQGYNGRNNINIENDKQIFCSLIYFYPDDKNEEIHIQYNKNFEYELNNKIKGMQKNACEMLIEELCNKSSKDNRNSHFIKDTKMEEKLKEDKYKNVETFTIYYLKVKTFKSLIELLNNKYITINENIKKILDKYFLVINNLNTSIKDIIINIQYILKFYEEINDYKWIKSQGEYYCLISIILLLNSMIQINKKDIDNPLGNKLEIDFYISDQYLAIEIDGNYHKTNKNIIKNDQIKDILLEKNNIELIRIDWNNNHSDFCKLFYKKLNNFYNNKYNENLNFNEDKYSEILTHFQNKTIFSSFTYNLKLDNELIINNIDEILDKIKNDKNILNNINIDIETHNNINKYNELLKINNI